jgi:hypothetical protein
MKSNTNRSKNQEHDLKINKSKTRPKEPNWEFEALEAVIRKWVTNE